MGEVLEQSRVGTAEPSVCSTIEVQDIYYLELQFLDPTLEADFDAATQALAIEARELAAELNLQKRTAKLLGKVALLEQTGPESATAEVAQPMTLMEAAKQAAEGNPEALQFVRKNALADYTERAYKSGHVVTADFSVNNNNQLVQHGQTAEEMFINGSRHMAHPVLLERSKIEAHNGQRQQYYYETGLLKDFAMVTFSLVPDVITPKEAKKAGYFTETMSYAIQLVTEENGRVIVQSAFVAGADSPGAPRFDKQVVAKTALNFGVDYSGADTEEILSRPALIHKSLLPDLVVTLVQNGDEKTGRFFGRPHVGGGDYQAHLTECQRRETNAESLVEEFVVKPLLAAAPWFTHPTDANKYLDQLNDKLLKQTVFNDESIDSNVLGAIATSHVEQARLHYSNGDFRRMKHAILEAQRIGSSSSCPTAYKLKLEFEDYSESDEDSSKPEICEFISKECPKCHAKNVPTTSVKRNGKTTIKGACGCVG
jgi:hypothetical protein